MLGRHLDLCATMLARWEWGWGYFLYNVILWLYILYINNNLHLARKYARIFVPGHYLFREANSFPRASLSENCSLLGTGNVQGQISEHIFAAELRLLCLLSICIKIGEYPRIFPSFSRGIFANVTRLDQSRASENIWLFLEPEWAI